MGQIGFFDLSKRYTGLDAKNEPLAKIDEVVPWEDFRGCLDAVCRRSDKARKSRAGRKPWDAVVMFKTIILSALYNLSDDQVEHQIRDRLSFMPPPQSSKPLFDVSTVDAFSCRALMSWTKKKSTAPSWLTGM